MAINKILDKLANLKEVVEFMISDIKCRHESGELKDIDIPLEQDRDSFKAKHPKMYKVISSVKEAFKFISKLVKFLAEENILKCIK